MNTLGISILSIRVQFLIVKLTLQIVSLQDGPFFSKTLDAHKFEFEKALRRILTISHLS